MAIGVYRPVHLRQINPDDPLGGYSCAAYSTAIAIDRATLGGLQVGGAVVRKATGLTAAQIRKQKGLFIQQVCNAAAALHVELTDRTGQHWDDVVVALKSGEGLILGGDYDVMLAEGFTCQASFLGNHMIYVNHIDASKKYGLTYDPLCKVARWVPLGVLRKYTEKIRGNNGTAMFATTRRTPNIVVTA